MGKRRKTKKLARANKFIELIDRHEPEEDKIMRALGEESNARDDLKMRARDQMMQPWDGWTFHTYRWQIEAYTGLLRRNRFDRFIIDEFIQAGDGINGRSNAAVKHDLLRSVREPSEVELAQPDRSIWMDVPSVRLPREGGS